MREVEFIAAAASAEQGAGRRASTPAAKAALLAAAAERLRLGRAAACEIVPFVPGRRPVDEAAHPWLGSSDQAALILERRPARRQRRLRPRSTSRRGDAAQAELDVTLSFAGIDGSIEPAPIPGWDRRPLAPRAFAAGQSRGARGRGAPALALDPPQRDLPWRVAIWRSPARTLAGATDGADPFTFGTSSPSRLRVELRLLDDGQPVAAARGQPLRLRRAPDGLALPPPDRAARRAGRRAPGGRGRRPRTRAPRFIPWYPVLLIGGDKAGLYGRALDRRHRRQAPQPHRSRLAAARRPVPRVADVPRHRRGGAATTPATCSTAASARRSSAATLFAAIRGRIDPARWREVWELRAIAFPRPGEPRTGPVAARNLLRKRSATLAFLEAHHEDLKAAIELAGPNHHNAQETWQRVFRDAERAVLRSTPAAFPELAFLPGPVRELVLWHRQRVARASRGSPAPLARLLGDQDGLFASACTQYRDR